MADLNFVAGDYVRLRLAKEEIEGTILENGESGIWLLKLPSGYNIGIAKENVLAGRALKKLKKETEEKVGVRKINNNKDNLSSIGLIITGGTIASKLDPKTGAVKHLTNVDELKEFYPELFDMVNVKVIDIPFMLASESMNSDSWLKIAQSVKKMMDDKEIKGIIITHGTDFLGYTSASLSFFLKKLNKPVVLTYSQRSIDRASSDAHLNLVCAAKMALSDVGEVMLVGHGSLNDDYCFALRGTKVRKMHSSRRDAFKAINDNPLAKVWPNRIEMLGNYRKISEKSEVDIEYSDKVALVKFYPGQDPSILDFYALKYKGVVLEVAGLGHLPVSEAGHSWIATLKKHIKNGFVVCAAAQTFNGRLDPYVYSNGRELIDAGVIFLEDMLPETALVKLGYVLGHYGWKKNVGEKMLENMAGELNNRLIYEG